MRVHPDTNITRSAAASSSEPLREEDAKRPSETRPLSLAAQTADRRRRPTDGLAPLSLTAMVPLQQHAEGGSQLRVEEADDSVSIHFLQPQRPVDPGARSLTMPSLRPQTLNNASLLAIANVVQFLDPVSIANFAVTQSANQSVVMSFPVIARMVDLGLEASASRERARQLNRDHVRLFNGVYCTAVSASASSFSMSFGAPLIPMLPVTGLLVVAVLGVAYAWDRMNDTVVHSRDRRAESFAAYAARRSTLGEDLQDARLAVEARAQQASESLLEWTPPPPVAPLPATDPAASAQPLEHGEEEPEPLPAPTSGLRKRTPFRLEP